MILLELISSFPSRVFSGKNLHNEVRALKILKKSDCKQGEQKALSVLKNESSEFIIKIYSIIPIESFDSVIFEMEYADSGVCIPSHLCCFHTILQSLTDFLNRHAPCSEITTRHYIQQLCLYLLPYRLPTSSSPSLQ